jgi:hypothetical protein
MPESQLPIRTHAIRIKKDMTAMTLAIISCLVVSVLVGCSGEKISPQLTDENGTLMGVLEIEPNPPVPMQDTIVRITLTDAGQPVRGAKIELTLTMPGCTMAPSFLEAIEAEEGIYQSQTVLTMAGAWQVDANISLQARSEALTFFFATQ